MNKNFWPASFFIISSSVLSLLAIEFILAKYNSSIANSSHISANLLRYHPTLGWTLTPNWQGQHQHHDFNASYSTNLLGFRGELSNFNQAQANSLAIVGDSFSFGLGVNDDQTFSSLINQQVANRVLNLSIPGYSTDQQLLLIKDMAPRLKAQHYVLFFYLGNDYLDIMLSYPLQAAQAKPLYTLLQQQLQLTNTPVPKTPKKTSTNSLRLSINQTLSQQHTPLIKLRQRSLLLQRLLPAPRYDPVTTQALFAQYYSDNSRLLTALLKELQQQLQQQGASLTVASLPNNTYLQAPLSADGLLQAYIEGQLQTICQQLSLDYWNLAQQLQQLYLAQGQPQWYYPHEGHLNPQGHQIIAQLIQQQFKL
ncbi:GDSL-type esterase/lipase family protein [Dasania sp. GY-MA-18]|uniref:SGNH/GDSL hydrolase family protein n=1 Tax=Dasania phycosphaerae TaxID=2950436 RepID=A0A9J6RKL4_9GAMM|nr:MULTISPECIES: SGNH/GDSL hydrolase family protein [Dasania]MCR8922307.1 GDSL-type esterase/lipase family protein [Dasania sp. GY-MA-18]MCZ0864735.1 SGNH/GDSL hydrolase family protein [Dasania phycosphaerae]MCZ0868463.1 SGNH/GDSL hydrolase family protein [Dasania phycosphaerae]